MVNLGYLEENHRTTLELEKRPEEVYEQKIKPLLEGKKYAEASKELNENRAAWSCLSKRELIAMVGFYQGYVIPKLVRTIFEDMKMDSLQELVMKDEMRSLGVKI